MADVIGKKISELAVTTDLAGLYTIGSDKNNQSKKVPLQFIKEAADYANAQGDYAKGVGDTVQGNTGVDEYPVFSASTQYATGSVVRYNDRLYRFTALHPAGAWVGTDAVETSIKAEADLKLTELSGKIDGLPIGDKFDSNGRYPSMTVGYSDNLVGRGDSTPEMFSFRASGGRSINDGAARIKTLRGNAVVWNQHLPNNGNWRVQDGTLTMENNAYVVKPTGDYPGVATSLQSAIPVGNKIAVVYDYYTQGAGDTYVNIGGNNSRISNVEQGAWKTIVHIIPCEKWNEAVGCVVFGSGAASVIKFKDIRCYDFTRMFGQGNEPTTIEKFNAMLPLNVDLNAYNEGEVIPFNGTAIKSVGDNAWDGLREMGDISGTTGEEFDSSSVWRTAGYIRILPNAEYCVEHTSSAFLRARFYDKDRNFIGIVSADNTDIYTNKTFTAPYNAYYIRFAPNSSVIPYDSELCVRLVHSGWKRDTGAPFEPYHEFIRNIDTRILEMFPDGIKAVKGAYDKVYNKNGKGYIEHRIGVKRMKDLTWTSPNSNLTTLGIFNAVIGDMRIIASGENETTYRKSGVLSKYAISNQPNFGEYMDDNSMWRQGVDYGIVVRNSAYTSVEAFVASLKDEDVVYYELAEPQVYEFSEPFNLDYEVADFGTEEVIASKPSAPISADIIYQFNAVDTIRDNQAEIEKIKAALAKAGITIDL